MSQIRMIVALTIMCVTSPMIMASSCQTRSAMQQVRDVHSSIVAAFSTTDRVVAGLFDRAGDECISAAREAGLDGEQAREHARSCMESRGWYTIEEVLSGSREALAELENVYDDIEAGRDRLTDWRAIATRLLAHGRRITELLEAVGVDVPDDLMSALTMLCNLTHCEE